MLTFFYWITGIVATIIVGFYVYKGVMKMKNIKIKQKAKHLEDVKGAKFELNNDRDIHVENLDIEQDSETIKNVIGLEVKTVGKQSMRLQDANFEQQGSTIKITDDPDIKVTINKQGDK